MGVPLVKTGFLRSPNSNLPRPDTTTTSGSPAPADPGASKKSQWKPRGGLVQMGTRADGHRGLVRLTVAKRQQAAAGGRPAEDDAAEGRSAILEKEEAARRI